jgi:hypothetical protein
MDASEGFEPKLVDEAPTPALPRLERADDRVLRLVEVLRGVAVPRIVTAPDVPARHAEPQVHPTVTAGEALLASVGLWAHVAINLCQMDTFGFLLLAHGASFFLTVA